MSATRINITPSRPSVYIRSVSKLQSNIPPSKVCFCQIHDRPPPSSSLSSLKLSVNASLRLQGLPELKCTQRKPVETEHQKVPVPVCLLGGKMESESGDQGSPWKALEKFIGNVKKGGQSIEDVLRQQIEKKEFYNGGSGKKPPSGGGGGGGSNGSGGPEDEGFSGVLDETLQVILATVGFIILYIYIINGEEITRLGKDYLKYLFGGSKSIRLQRAMEEWGRYYQKWTEQEVEEDPYFLEKAILNTPTMWDHPEKYRRVVRAYMESYNSDDEEDDDGNEKESKDGADEDEGEDRGREDDEEEEEQEEEE